MDWYQDGSVGLQSLLVRSLAASLVAVADIPILLPIDCGNARLRKRGHLAPDSAW